MRVRGFSLIGGLIRACVCSALAADNDRPGPPLGTWSLVGKESSDKGNSPSLVIVRRDGNRFDGYIDWRPQGTAKCLEIISGTFDAATRAVRIAGREMHAKVELVRPAQYEATLSADGKEFQNLRAAGPNAQPPFSAKWTGVRIPATDDLVTAALAPASDRDKVYQQISADYKLDGAAIIHGPDRVRLTALAKSGDEHVRELAGAYLMLQGMFEDAQAEDSAAKAKVAAERQIELAKFVGRTFSDASNDARSALKNCVDLFNSPMMKSAFSRRTAGVILAGNQAAVADRIRRDARAAAESVRPAKPALPPGGFEASFKVGERGIGVMVLTNKSGRDLHNCLVATRMRVDGKQMDDFQAKFIADSTVPAVLLQIMGVDMQAALRGDKAALFYHRIDKGTTSFVPLWKRGSTLEVEVAQPEGIVALAGAVGAWIGGDEGLGDVPLDIDAVRRISQAGRPTDFKLHLAIEEKSGFHTTKALAFRTDGQALFSGSSDFHVRSWDLSTGESIREEGGVGTIDALAASPDGKLVAIGDSFGKLRLLDAQSLEELVSHRGRPVGHFKKRDEPGPLGNIFSLAFSPDSRTVATASNDTTARLWDVASRTSTHTLAGHKKAVRAVAFSPDGLTLATGSDDSTVKLWDPVTGKEAATLAGHSGPVVALAFNHDGKVLVSGSSDKSARLWHVASGTTISEVRNEVPISAVAVSPDGRLLATGAEKAGIALWDPLTAKRLGVLPAKEAVPPIAFSPDSKRLATTWSADQQATPAKKRAIRIWDLTSPGDTVPVAPLLERLAALKGTKPQHRNTNEIRVGSIDLGSGPVAFSPDGKTLATTAGPGGPVLLFDVNAGKQQAMLTESRGIPEGCFSRQGTLLASGGKDGSGLKFWNVESGKEIGTVKDLESGAKILAISADWKTLAGSGPGKSFKLWDGATGKELFVLRAASESERPKRPFGGRPRTLSPADILCAAFSPDGQTLATGSQDRTIVLWDVASGKEKATLTDHQKDVIRVAYSPDGVTLASASFDKTIKLWNVPNRTVRHTLTGHAGNPMAMAFSPDGGLLASGSANDPVKLEPPEVRLWSVATGKSLIKVTPHHGYIHGIAFSADGQQLATSGGASSESLLLWKVNASEK